MANCPQCGAPITDGAAKCKFCGEAFAQQAVQQPVQQPQVIIQQVPQQQNYQQQGFQQPAGDPAINPNWPVKNKTTAGILAILLGGLGIHKFYLGKGGLGVLYLIFCWTYIPGILGLIEGIVYLTQNERDFQIKNQVRTHY